MTTVLAAILGGAVGLLATVTVYALTGSVLLMAIVGLPLAWTLAAFIGLGVGILRASRR